MRDDHHGVLDWPTRLDRELGPAAWAARHHIHIVGRARYVSASADGVEVRAKVSRLKHGSVRASGCNFPGLLDRPLTRRLVNRLLEG